MAQKAENVRIEGRELKITRPEKVLFPEDGITKGDLISYYQKAGAWMLPHLRHRTLAMERYPDGIDQAGFYQKAVGPYYPDWIRTLTVKKAGGTVTQVICDDLSTLMYLANQACITPHTWLSRVDKLDQPDQMIFDLDPTGDDFSWVISAAHSLKELLEEVGLPGYLKATGSYGLHVVVPLDRRADFDSVREFARELAEIVVNQDVTRYTMEQRKNKRRGRVFIDTNRNAYAQTAVAPYAVRARRGAPVSVPLDWDELGTKGIRPDGYTIKTVLARLEKIEDPWRDFWQRAASIDRARRKLEEIYDTHGISPKEKIRRHAGARRPRSHVAA
jgi:bifunctional non-homologous end joining protein LigD